MKKFLFIFILVVLSSLTWANVSDSGTEAGSTIESQIIINRDLIHKMRNLGEPADSTESVVEKDRANKQLITSVINDFFTPRNTDRNLTNGIKIGFISDKLPDFMDWYKTTDGQDYYLITVTQNIYTPEDLSKTDYIKTDRPYAGWLFATIAVGKRTDNTINMTVMDIGVVGPNSQADKVQTIYHRLINAQTPRGWDNQLENEFGYNLKHYYGKTVRYNRNSLTTDLTGIANISLGNVDTSLSATAVARFGYNIPDDLLLFSADSKSAKGSNTFSIYTFAGMNASYVVRDMFLDGNTFNKSRSIEKYNNIKAVFVGLTIGLKNIGLTYTYSEESKRFIGQKGNHRSGIISLTYSKKY